MNYLKQFPRLNYGYIYKYTSPIGKSYVGQTVRSLYSRAGLNGRNYYASLAFYGAIQKYGFENFSVEILGEYPIEQLDERGAYYIEYYNSLAPNGYNLLEGGKSAAKKAACKKINQFDLEGNFIKQYSSLKEAAEDNNTQYQSISAVLRGKRKQHNNYIYKYLGEEPEPVIKKKNQGRQTAQYDLEGNFIAIYPSANQAAAAIGKNSNAGRNIRAVCEGKRKTAYGFIWKFID